MKITHFETGPLSVNTVLIPLKNNRILIVDPGGSFDLIISQIQQMHAEPECILLTHGHFDHLIAVPSLLSRFPAMSLYIHESDSHFLGSQAMEQHTSFFDCIGARGLIDKFRISLPQASAFVKEGDVLYGWKVLHTPGHSAGSICLYSEEEGVLISGDTLFCGGIGRSDAPGGDFAQLTESLKGLSNLPKKTIVFPGHGSTTTIEEEFQ